MVEPKEETQVVEPEVAAVTEEQSPKESEKLPFTLEQEAFVQKLFTEKFKGIQRVVNTKDKEIKALKEQVAKEPDRDNSQAELYKAVLQVIEDGGDPDSIKKAKMVFQEAERKAAQNTQLTRQTRIINERRTEFEKTIEDAGLDVDDPRLIPYDLSFNHAMDTGDFDQSKGSPKNVLSRLLKTITPPIEGDKPMTSDVEIQKMVDAKVRQELIDRGVLKTDSGAVSGSSAGKQIYTQTEINDRTFWEANKDDIILARKEGRIK